MLRLLALMIYFPVLFKSWITLSTKLLLFARPFEQIVSAEKPQQFF
jgi:hypothetical protein